MAAVSTPFLTLHVTRDSLMIGWLVGVVVSWLTIRLAIRRLARLPVGRLLAGETEAEVEGTSKKRSSWPRVREALMALAALLVVTGYLLTGESQAGAFFASGAAVLALLLGEVRHQLLRLGRTKRSYHALSLVRLAALNTARHPGRSTLTIGLVATATFLIAAVSAFRLDTGEEGTGGFTLLATSDQPIHYDLNTPAGRTELGFSRRRQEDELADWTDRTRCGLPRARTPVASTSIGRRSRGCWACRGVRRARRIRLGGHRRRCRRKTPILGRC